MTAERLAFGPLIFQAVHLLRDRGVLQAARSAGKQGISLDGAIAVSGLSNYATRVLLEAGLAAEVLTLAESPSDGSETYRVTSVGLAVLSDSMVRANFNFVRDVCYLGAERLEEALVEGRPAGLSVFGEYRNVYEALSTLPPQVQQSWFAVDHIYSDQAFPFVLPRVLRDRPQRLVDVGGNTGRFALLCLQRDPSVQVTVVDLPGQLARARRLVDAEGLGERLTTEAVDLLDPGAPLLADGRTADVFWMSQLLSCFAPEQVTSVLRRVRAAMDGGSRLFILENFWDRQQEPEARFCLQATSLYFASIANGTSKMHRATDLLPCVERAGLFIEEDVDEIDPAHTLWVCRPA